MEKIYLSSQTSLLVTIIVGLFFIGLGYLNSNKAINNRNYIIGNRDENTFSLTTSLAASALGAWILFGPASAATWGRCWCCNRICIGCRNTDVISI